MSTPRDSERSMIALAYVVIGAAIVGFMYWAQAVLVPLALAILLTLVLTPLVTALQRLRVPRLAAILLVVALATGAVVGMGWLVARQFVQLAGELPNYRQTITDKIDSLKQMATVSPDNRLGRLIDDVTKQIKGEAKAVEKAVSEVAPAEQTSASGAPPANPPVPAQPPAVIVEEGGPSWVEQAMAAAGSIGDAVLSFALAAVLTVFMLLNRENMRDRLIRVVGHGRLTATTKAFDEAMHRVSQFLLMQLIVNATYGISLSLGLLLLGVPYALLWGLLAAVLRYIPYLGAWIAAAPPVLLSVVMFDGWTHPLLVIGWIVIIELVSNNFVEPLLYGRSMGVSEVALIVAATFWAFLWGPIGLVLSSPLTVCLVVLGKYVPQLGFIDVLLGDSPPLPPHVSLYQRLLAHDKDEAREIALAYLKKTSRQQAFDELLIASLSLFKDDWQREVISDEDERFVVAAFGEIVEAVDQASKPALDDKARQAIEAGLPEPLPKVRVLFCPAEGAADEIALSLLQRLMDPLRWEVRRLGDDALAGEVLELVEQQKLPVVCIGSVAPGGLSHARYFCKRLQTCCAEVRIVVGRFGLSHQSPRVEQQLREAGASEVEWTLLDTGRHLDSWWPVLSGRDERAAPSEPTSAARS